MNAPLIWVGIPALSGLILFFTARWKRATEISGLAIALLLTWLAFELPLGQAIPLGLKLPALLVEETLTLFGRTLTLDQSVRPVLQMFYLGLAIWCGGLLVVDTDRFFVPFSLAITALLTACLVVTPTLYAAVIFAIAIILCVPILSPPGRPSGPGVLRFLVFQTLGVCLILLGDWFLPVTAAVPGGLPSVLRATTLIILGLALVSALLPFHTWVPMIAEQAPPYAASFVLFILPTAVSFLWLEYLQRYASIGVAPTLLDILRLIGGVTSFAFSFWAAMERDLGRIMGFSVSAQTGNMLLAASLAEPSQTGSPLVGLLLSQRIVQGASLAMWGLSLAVLRDHARDYRFRTTKGLAYRLPWTSAGLVSATLCMAGVPLLGGFPTQAALWSALAPRYMPGMILSMGGSLLLAATALRCLAVLLARTEPIVETHDERKIKEPRVQKILLAGGWIFFLIFGLLPQLYMPYLTSMATMLTNPVP